MNDKMFDIIGLADEKYLREAQEQPARKITHRRLSAKFVAVAAAAAIMTVSAGAYAVAKLSHKESVGKYYDSSAVSKIEDSGYAVGKVSRNAHFEVTLESVMGDDYRCQPIVTLKPLDNEAIKCMSEFSYEPKIAYTDGGEIENKNDDKIFNNVGLINPGSHGKSFYDPAIDGESQPVMVFIYYQQGKTVIDRNRPLTMTFRSLDKEYESIFDGISFDLPKKQSVPSTTFYSPSGNELYISQFGMVGFAKVPTDVEDLNYKVNFTDGSSKDNLQLGTKGTNLNLNGTEKGWSFEFITLVDIDDIVSVELYGEVYTRK